MIVSFIHCMPYNRQHGGGTKKNSNSIILMHHLSKKKPNCVHRALPHVCRRLNFGSLARTLLCLHKPLETKQKSKLIQPHHFHAEHACQHETTRRL
mmetsp:Transcript_20763/g.46104  ORF Transcript_20763/g.46104 Transcript_20763/m.46104 type:complete len:96 (-) Transcript_20763:37-324(-)